MSNFIQMTGPPLGVLGPALSFLSCPSSNNLNGTHVQLAPTLGWTALVIWAEIRPVGPLLCSTMFLQLAEEMRCGLMILGISEQRGGHVSSVHVKAAHGRRPENAAFQSAVRAPLPLRWGHFGTADLDLEPDEWNHHFFFVHIQVQSVFRDDIDSTLGSFWVQNHHISFEHLEEKLIHLFFLIEHFYSVPFSLFNGSVIL